ncbi:hypothetical protein [Bacillus solitudinis]|uniref:hypothetical protein n=1 Tax=Bacillus solitudinis TaxID=2014074 RepID=UPI000C249F1B|nr:hypothetical protein [Bacillus solitudinis]
MTYLINYAIHLLISVLFFILIAFPFLIKGTMEEKQKQSRILNTYQRVIWLAHGGLIIALVSGILMTTDWLSIWVWLVLLCWIVLGAFLGLTAKMCRLTIEKLKKNEDSSVEFEKLRRFSLLLSIAIIVMFALKFIRYV